MAILEFGINLGMKNLIEIKYYSSDSTLDPDLRAGFLSALESFVTEVFGDDINVISLASFKLVCYCEMITLPNEDAIDNKQPLLSYAIIEKGTDATIVKEQLNQIISYFLNRYSLNDIFSKKPRYFREFEIRINEVLGDLRLKTEDRFRSIF
ncbi:MAG: hypothetical protein JSV62_13535 [Promethearchaeota archaeon]|nr:MAG: hypothetical protein JSV62_13535 [Candidatus Lokiarchaeota archaeon]